MTSTARGISDHELLYMIETTRMRLATMCITGPLADRLIITLVFGALGDTAEQARGVADRFFPLATRPAVQPECTANEPEPTRQA